MKKTIIVINVLIVLLIILQLLAYYASMKNNVDPSQADGSFAYYLGYNFPLILSIILLFISRNLKRKIAKKQ